MGLKPAIVEPVYSQQHSGYTEAKWLACACGEAQQQNWEGLREWISPLLARTRC